MIAIALLCWLLVAWITVAPPPWLIGPGSLLETLLPGTQHYMGYEGIEGAWFVLTLPVLIGIARMDPA